MFCSNCGTKVPDGAKFCQECGAMVITGSDGQKQENAFVQPVQGSMAVPKKKQSNKLFIILAVIAVFIVILIAANAGDTAKKGEQETEYKEDIADKKAEADEAAATQKAEDDKQIPIPGTDEVAVAQKAEDAKPLFPLATSSDAEKVFQEWADTHSLAAPYHLTFISDDSTDNGGNEVFLFTLETNGAGMFNMTIRKSDGYMEYLEKFGSMSMDEWYEGWFGNNDDAPLGYEENVPYGYEDSYLDYQAWGGGYDGGWMDTTLWLSLYSDGTQDPGCGYLTANFRGNEATGKLYFLGGASFRWESEGYYDGAPIETYYVLAINNGGKYQLELYDANWVHEVTFTQYEQYIP